MKKSIAFLLVVCLAGAVFANCGNDNGNGNGCSGGTQGPVGPQGPSGPQGPVGPQGQQGITGPQGTSGQNGSNGANGANGINGTNGTSGKDGKDGAKGADGKDATSGFTGTMLVGDFALRLYDGKRIQVQAFDIYQFGSTQGDDIFGNGRNQMIGGRIVLKLGPSYEEREIARLKKMLGVR